MSYAISGALQAAIFQQISQDAAVSALIGSDIFDAPPTGTPPATYVSLGQEIVRDRSDKDGAGAQHDLTISVITDQAGFQAAKAVAAAVSDALAAPLPPLSRGHLVAFSFVRARARLESSASLRRIDMSFRALVQDT